MNRIAKRFSTLGMLVLSLFAWGCDTASDMTQPELAPSPMIVQSITGQRYVVAWEWN